MLFNSIDFAIFLPAIFTLYWFFLGGKIKAQNALILIASYLFYGWWDWRFLSLIAFSTVLDFYIGNQLPKHQDRLTRRLLLFTSILVNIGFLGFFKYYNFFIDNFIEAFSFFGMKLHSSSLNIVLPVGISFYTFQTLSYTIDVYKRKLNPTHDFIAFAAFVSFFPQLVAGPIERATNLLPQFFKNRKFDVHKAIDGLRQMLWGFFKKIVIADNCAEYANLYFNNYEEYSGFALLYGAIFFAFQIYADFSGYSDIAIGTSRLFGFRLMRNFAFPYFSRDIAEFWRRWHMSLSTWFRDYLYIPLGGSQGGNWKKIRNTFIIFIVSGFWHGANWTFLFWGFLNALYFLPLLLSKRNRNHLNIIAEKRNFPSIKEFGQMALTFGITLIAWVFFRAENIQHAFNYIGRFFLEDFFDISQIPILSVVVMFLILFFVVIEWLGRHSEHALQSLFLTRIIYLRWSFYYLIIAMIIVFAGLEQEFIYFQF